MTQHPIAIIAGTRPEAIKLAPVIRELLVSPSLRPIILSTSQQRPLVTEAFGAFGLKVDHDLRVMKPSQSLWDLSGRLITRLGKWLTSHPVSAVLVQGDTTTALMGGLAAYYHQVPVGHVEAGLRSGDPYAPFPEEMNRKLLTSIARWHFAPTADAVSHLKQEGIPASRIYRTGNTVVDAMHWMTARAQPGLLPRRLQALPENTRLILVTCHRRESFGKPLQSLVRGLARLARANPDVILFFPVHPNPEVRRVVDPELRGVPNVILSRPLVYPKFLACLRQAHVVLSDSGGVQEEATALGKPVLVLRDQTERQEGVTAGVLKQVGLDGDRVARECQHLLGDSRRLKRMSRASRVYGDGHAARRIVQALAKALG